AASGQASGLVINFGDNSGSVLGTSSQSLSVPNTIDFVIGDFNGDGISDIGVIAKITPKICDFYPVMGSPGKKLIRRTTVTLDQPITPNFQVTAADINRDGLTDLVLTDGQTVAVELAIGDPGVNGNFAGFKLSDVLKSPGYITDIAIGDLDGDGRVD